MRAPELCDDRLAYISREHLAWLGRCRVLMTWRRGHRRCESSVHSWSVFLLGVFVVVLAAVVGTTVSLPSHTLRVLVVSVLLYGIVILVRHYLRRARERRAADAWIARGYEGRAAWYAWRIAELTASRERRLLARSLRRVLSELSDSRIEPLSPLNRKELRPHQHLIDQLSRRLEDLDRPVSAAGILAVNQLLTNPSSALYRRGRNVPASLRETIDRLEPCH